MTRTQPPSPLFVKRCHGLGNVIMLLPVLNQLAEQDIQVHLITQTRWAGTLQKLNPNITISDHSEPSAIDLDLATNSLRPTSHRSKEFAEFLGVSGPVGRPRLAVPVEWTIPFASWEGSIGFAPEAGHSSRQWPVEYCQELAKRLQASPLVILGTESDPSLPCDLDTRGHLGLEDLLGLLKVLRSLICLDSGMLHLAAAVGVPTVCIFGGINPQFRVHRSQGVLSLQAALPCCPCNKQETCDGRYDCIKTIKPHDVLRALGSVDRIATNTVVRI